MSQGRRAPQRLGAKTAGPAVREGRRRLRAAVFGGMLLLEVRLLDRPVNGPVIPDTALEPPQLGAAEPVRVSFIEWLDES